MAAATADDERLHGREVVVVEVGLAQHERDLGRDPPEPDHAVLGREPEGVGGTPLRHDVGGGAAHQVARQLGHGPEVGHRGPAEGRPAATPPTAGVHLGDVGELTSSEHRALRQARRARGEDHRDRSLGVVGERVGSRVGDAQRREHRAGIPRLVDDEQLVGAPVAPDELGGRDHGVGIGHADDTGPLLGGQSGVHPGRHRAELGERDVEQHVLGRRWQDERDDVALPDTPVPQADGDLVGDAVEVPVGQGPTGARDEGTSIAPTFGGLPDGSCEHVTPPRGRVAPGRTTTGPRGGTPRCPRLHPLASASCAPRASGPWRSSSTPA
ncbi:MAG: hypothetical protein U5R31_09920 [Acidimicrobiia bacterium]|nr:hypothetical protein [Acidimicrobiia bacterium]